MIKRRYLPNFDFDEWRPAHLNLMSGGDGGDGGGDNGDSSSGDGGFGAGAADGGWGSDGWGDAGASDGFGQGFGDTSADSSTGDGWGAPGASDGFGQGFGDATGDATGGPTGDSWGSGNSGVAFGDAGVGMGGFGTGDFGGGFGVGNDGGTFGSEGMGLGFGNEGTAGTGYDGGFGGWSDGGFGTYGADGTGIGVGIGGDLGGFGNPGGDFGLSGTGVDFGQAGVGDNGFGTGTFSSDYGPDGFLGPNNGGSNYGTGLGWAGDFGTYGGLGGPSGYAGIGYNGLTSATDNLGLDLGLGLTSAPPSMEEAAGINDIGRNANPTTAEVALDPMPGFTTGLATQSGINDLTVAPNPLTGPAFGISGLNLGPLSHDSAPFTTTTTTNNAPNAIDVELAPAPAPAPTPTPAVEPSALATLLGAAPEAPAASPAEALATVLGAQQETPAETPAEAPAVAPNEAPAIAPNEAQAIAPTEAVSAPSGAPGVAGGGLGTPGTPGAPGMAGGAPGAPGGTAGFPTPDAAWSGGLSGWGGGQQGAAPGGTGSGQGADATPSWFGTVSGGGPNAQVPGLGIANTGEMNKGGQVALSVARANIMSQLAADPALANKLAGMLTTEIGRNPKDFMSQMKVLQTIIDKVIARAGTRGGQGRGLSAALDDVRHNGVRNAYFQDAPTKGVTAQNYPGFNAMLGFLARGANPAGFGTGNASGNVGAGVLTTAAPYGRGQVEKIGIETVAPDLRFARQMGAQINGRTVTNQPSKGTSAAAPGTALGRAAAQALPAPPTVELPANPGAPQFGVQGKGPSGLPSLLGFPGKSGTGPRSEAPSTVTSKIAGLLNALSPIGTAQAAQAPSIEVARDAVAKAYAAMTAKGLSGLSAMQPGLDLAVENAAKQGVGPAAVAQAAREGAAKAGYTGYMVDQAIAGAVSQAIANVQAKGIAVPGVGNPNVNTRPEARGTAADKAAAAAADEAAIGRSQVDHPVPPADIPGIPSGAPSAALAGQFGAYGPYGEGPGFQEGLDAMEAGAAKGIGLTTYGYPGLEAPAEYAGSPGHFADTFGPNYAGSPGHFADTFGPDYAGSPGHFNDTFSALPGPPSVSVDLPEVQVDAPQPTTPEAPAETLAPTTPTTDPGGLQDAVPYSEGVPVADLGLSDPVAISLAFGDILRRAEMGDQEAQEELAIIQVLQAQMQQQGRSLYG